MDTTAAEPNALAQALIPLLLHRVNILTCREDVSTFLDLIQDYLHGPQVRGGIPSMPLDDPTATAPATDQTGDTTTPSQETASQETTPKSDGADPSIKYAPSAGLATLQRIIHLLLEHNGRILAIIETNHIDSVYRDLYYHWYSRRAANVPRFTLRISFFHDYLGRDKADWNMLSNDRDSESSDEVLAANFIGSTVIYPIGEGLLGRTLLAPGHLINKPSHMRLTTYYLNILGRKLSVRAFPFRMQDAEMMSCAETTLLNLLDYYSTNYSTYASTKPSDLVGLEEDIQIERAVPVRGLDFARLTQILGKVGFYPRLQSLTAFEHSALMVPGEVQLRRYLFWHLASGIPAAVNIAPLQHGRPGHALAVIGFTDCPQSAVDAVKCVYGCSDQARTRDTYDHDPVISATLSRMDVSGWLLVQAEPSGTERARATEPEGAKTCRVIQEVDFPRNLVTINDCELPYDICSYDRMSQSSLMQCAYVAVPLHQRMSLDAQDAYVIFETILEEPEIGLFKWAGESIADGDTVVMRMFLLTAGSYRNFRISTSEPPIRHLYETLVLPHFIWVAELVLLSEYDQDSTQCRAFAEIVLDSTVCGRVFVEDKLLFMRYPERVAWRVPDDPEVPFKCHFSKLAALEKEGNEGEAQARQNRFRCFPFALTSVTPASPGRSRTAPNNPGQSQTAPNNRDTIE